MKNMEVMGCKYSEGIVPTLIAKCSLSSTKDLLVAEFETNPLDSSANQKINIQAEPLEIIYDSV